MSRDQRRGEAELEAAGGRGAIAANGKPVESVWDFPRPPTVEPVGWRIRVVHAGLTIVDAPSAVRVLETSQAPAYYVAPEWVDLERLQPAIRRSRCEWKGTAIYADVAVGTDGGASDACWSYREPTPAFDPIRGHWAFYAQAVDECWVDDERVAANDGDFYGGWITANVTGPFKGAPGTLFW
ncbi:MAG: DUF427 domain-containing protein [Ilumatobacter sp.]|jgi:uncharacterized protein (DUF427 family)|uniref:DUF427 domain-containing protein n=1 Tax=Ilumatobacter sp. TaxID=1967498 RepID=UPI00391A6E30